MTKRRIPIWAALLPLAIAMIAYWLYWKAEARSFRAAVAQVLPDSPIAIGGFPYRIEARLPATSRRWERADSFMAISVANAVVNRQPWRTGHAVVAAENVKLQVALPEIAGARLDIEAPAALASIRRPAGVVERLSVQFSTARVWLPVAGGPFDAKALELHLRETPSSGEARGPTHAGQAEARIAGTLTRRGGPTFRIEVPLVATAARRISSVADWRDGGTLEIKGGRLLAADGAALAGFDATLAPLPDGRIAIAGVMDTDCPATMRAFVEGRVPPAEYRSRRTQRLPFSGIDGIMLGPPEGASGGPVRSQEPPCPDLHR